MDLATGVLALSCAKDIIAEKQDSITTQNNCIGPFVVPDRKDIPELDILMETRKGVAVSYSPAEIAS